MSNNEAEFICMVTTLDPSMVYQKIMLCDIGRVTTDEKELEVKWTRGVEIILANVPSLRQDLFTISYFLPATYVDFKSREDDYNVPAYLNH